MKSDSLFDILPLKNNEILSEETYNFFFTSLKKKSNGMDVIWSVKTSLSICMHDTEGNGALQPVSVTGQ